MQENINAIVSAALQAAKDATSAAQLDEVRVAYLGKKGEITGLLRVMGTLEPQERPAYGAQVNLARDAVEQALAQCREAINAKQRQEALQAETIDITMPGKRVTRGHMHLLESAQRQMAEIFIDMGFTVEEGPEIELDRYNFELLNLPQNHPARDMHDTFYITESILLRTHTSPVQARVMLAQKPPIRIICPGRVYRLDEIDASHSPVFHQMEGLVIDKDISMSHLYGLLDLYAKRMYGENTKIRFRPSYFPFTEPSAEMDISCTVCGGVGCPTCKGTGWIELMGCGMVNPKVLQNCGIDPQVYSGFAFGMGIDRAAMMRNHVTDMRLLIENDARFNRQF